MFGRALEKSVQDAPPSVLWYTPRSAPTQTRLAFAGSTSIALIGSPGSPAVRSVHDEPPLSERYTRPPPTVRYVAHMRDRLFGSTYRHLTTPGGVVRGVASAVSAGQLAPFHCVLKTRPSVVPTYMVLALGMYMALVVVAVGNARRVQVVPVFRET